jgi:hypothetical protein
LRSDQQRERLFACGVCSRNEKLPLRATAQVGIFMHVPELSDDSAVTSNLDQYHRLCLKTPSCE